VILYTYNCGTGGVTDAVIEKLEVYNRRQLRETLGIRKRELSNEEVYKRCGTNRLKGDIAYAMVAIRARIKVR
jgi:hypothetical protein